MGIVQEYKELGLQLGMSIEIWTLKALENEENEEEMRAVGTIRDFEEDEIIIAPKEGKRLPIMRAGVELILRGTNETEQVVIAGITKGMKLGRLRVGSLELIERVNRRESFRQNLNRDARVQFSATLPNGRKGRREADCRVMDISQGGVCIKLKDELTVGESIRVADLQLSSREKYTLDCAVRWRRESIEDNKLYGCQFENMDSKRLDEVAREIMAIQIQEVRRRRLMGK